MNDGSVMVVKLIDENGVKRRGPLLSANYRAARALARDLTDETGERISVYCLGAKTGDHDAEAGRIALDPTIDANCAWFLDHYDADAAQSRQCVFDGLEIRMEPFEKGGIE
jgi:hypothetical protein